MDKATMLRGDGANYGQTGFATNTSLLRNDFRTDQGIGVPVFWDGRSWRTYANELEDLIEGVMPGPRGG